MNKYQKEYLEKNIEDEKEALEKLRSVYEDALEEVKLKIKNLMEHKEMSSRIYQAKYQYALQKQLEEALSKMDEFDGIVDYLENCYETGYLGTLYDLNMSDIPLIIPIDQEQVTNAIFNQTKLKDGLYTRLGYNRKELAKILGEEISRGIATSSSFADVAININKRFGIGMKKSYLIARTEGHRVMTTASYHAQLEAKDKGCNIVKQWDATLDGRTRPSHRQVDGEIRELDEKFSNGLLYPSDHNGSAEEVCNCRCALLQRATWALDDEELQILKDRANYYGLDKTKNFDDFTNKFLKATKGMKK